MTTEIKKKRLRGFDFSGDDHHVALVCEDVGGAANGYKTLVTKSTDMTVELSLAEFLYRFTSMWSGDAELVARMLGYSDNMDATWDTEELEKRVTLMKSAKETGEVTDELLETVQVLSKAVGIPVKDTNGASPVSNKNVEKASNGAAPVNNEEVDNMPDKDLQAEIQKALDAQKAEIEKSVKAQVEAEHLEIEKGLKAKIDEYQAKEVEVEKAKYKEFAKSYSKLGIDSESEEAVDGMAVALMKMKGDDTFKPVMTVLEKALNIATQVEKGAFEEQGHDIEVDADMSPDEKLKQAIEKSKNSK